MKIKFSKQSIDNLVCSKPRSRLFYRDSSCRGLCIEVRVSGGKTYYLSYRDERGRQRLYKLANADDVSPKQAQQLCDRARNRIAMGENLVAQRQEMRSSMTMSEFFNDRYLPYIKSYKRSWSTDESVFRNHVAPVLGDSFMDATTNDDVARVLSRASQLLSAATVNRVLVLMRYMFNLARRWHITGVVSNPTDQQKLKKLSNHRERFLTETETHQLLKSVNQSPNRMLKYIVPFLLLTGARKREVLDARWCDMDIHRKSWRIPMTKSGRARHVPLSQAALELLERLSKKSHGEWVFANPKTGKPYVSIFCSWHTARTLVGLEDVRIHDLRHSFASFLVNAGCSLYEVQKILGHSSVSMTQRYSHLSQESLLRAASMASVYVVPAVQI